MSGLGNTNGEIADLLRKHYAQLAWLPFAAAAYWHESGDEVARKQAELFYKEGRRDLPILEVYERILYAVETGEDLVVDEDGYRCFLQIGPFSERIQGLSDEGLKPFVNE